MSKADKLMSRFGSNIAETIGLRHGVEPAGPQASSPPADKFAGAIRSRAFGELPVESIGAEAQPRTEFDDDGINRLADSIKRYGQLAPIRVRHDEASGRWVVLVGERRLRACRAAGLPRVRVEFVERAMTEADVYAEQVVENAVRADLKPVEQTRAYSRLMELNGWSAQQLAQTLGVEETAVYRSLGLARLPDDVAERVDSGEIRATAAYEISKLADPEDQRELAGRVVAEGLDHSATVAEVRRRKSGSSGQGGSARPDSGRSAKLPRVKVAGGKVTIEPTRVVLELRREGTAAKIAAFLREIADQLDPPSALDRTEAA